MIPTPGTSSNPATDQITVREQPRWISAARLWCLMLILLLPIQLQVARYLEPLSSNAARAFRYLDEITIVLLAPLAVYHLLRRRALPPGGRRLLWILGVFGLYGVISGWANGATPMILGLGIFDYLKNFLPVFIFMAFVNREEDLRLLVRLLIISAVILSAVALLQQITLLVQRNILHNLDWTRFTFSRWRMGFYRTPSLFTHPNPFSYYLILVFALLLATRRNVRWTIFVPLFIGLICTFTRISLVAFLLLAAWQFLRGRRWLAVPGLIVILVLAAIQTNLRWGYLPPAWSSPDRAPLLLSEKSFRGYAFTMGLRIWKDHPLLGVGPGRFGGVVSLQFESDLYRTYEFDSRWLTYMKRFNSLDQFWVQLLAELGIAGALFFLALLSNLLLILWRRRSRAGPGMARDTTASLIAASIFIFLYTTASGLNVTPFLFTYSALVGLSLRPGRASPDQHGVTV